VDQVVDGKQLWASAQPHEQHFERRARLATSGDVIEALREPLVQADQVVGVRFLRQRVYFPGFVLAQVE